MTLQVRAKVYRHKPGYKISGRLPDRAFPVSVWTETRASAEKIRARLKAGQQIQEGDWK